MACSRVRLPLPLPFIRSALTSCLHLSFDCWKNFLRCGVRISCYEERRSVHSAVWAVASESLHSQNGFFLISLIKSREANEAPSRYNPQDAHYCNAEYLNKDVCLL